MSTAKQVERLMPKGVYACEKCAKQTQVFVRVFEVKCGQHGQMTRKVGA